MTLQRHTRSRGWPYLLLAVASCFTLLLAVAPAAHAQQPNVDLEPFPVGFFYGTFFESPNTMMLVGGTAEQFCDANPADAFAASPGMAESRTQILDDGSVRVSVLDPSQPIYLYRTSIEGAPVWINSLCADRAAGRSMPEPFAAGLAKLRVAIRIAPDGTLDVFNSAKGWARGTDGTHFRVTGSADFEVVNGMPVGAPSDFVSFRLLVVGRHGVS